MNKYYTLSYSAGFLRSNKFEEKEDAILLGSERAKLTGKPVSIFEWQDKEDTKILICNPDGSVEKPQKDKNSDEIDFSFEAGKDVASESHMLLASYQDKKVTTFYLRSSFPEIKLPELEAHANISIGLMSVGEFDDTCLLAYDQSPQAIAKVEEYLAKAGIEIDHVSFPQYKKKKETPIVVEALVSPTNQALPKINPVVFSYGDGSKVRQIEVTADVYRVSKTGKFKYLVKVNGTAVGTTASIRTCKKLMREEALIMLNRYLDKVL